MVLGVVISYLGWSHGTWGSHMVPGVVTWYKQLCYNKNRGGSYTGHCGYFIFFCKKRCCESGPQVYILQASGLHSLSIRRGISMAMKRGGEREGGERESERGPSGGLSSEVSSTEIWNI